MDFKPVNSEHSVQSVTFVLALDGMIPSSAFQSVKLQELQRELPAVQTPEFEIGAASSVRRIHGIQFAHLRPDGTPAWALRILGNEITVECSRYTRWEKVWGVARQYFEAALAAAAAGERQRKVTAIGQNFIDVFVANRDKYDLQALLKPGDLLVTKAFTSSSPSWHSHIGWFEDKGITWLNQLNIDAVQRPDPSAEQRLHIQITHNQRLGMNPPLALSDEVMAVLDAAMEKLHIQNKGILRQLLSRPMQKQIGLELGE
jgi:uncharacterized protein (TIGR04255 family)